MRNRKPFRASSSKSSQSKPPLSHASQTKSAPFKSPQSKSTPSRSSLSKSSAKSPLPRSSSVRVSLGIHAVKEALKVRPQEILRFIVKKGWESSKDLQEMVREVRKGSIPIEEQASEMIDRWGRQHQGVACEIRDSFSCELQELGQASHSIVLALDGIEDPHNLGAILRTAWLMGVEAVILPSDRAVGLTPTVHKVSCGGVEHVPVIQVVNLASALSQLKEKGFWIYGLAAKGSMEMGQLKIAEKVVWVLGAEDKGLRSTSEKVCDELVSLPQRDNAASYNVSVAAGMTLYETHRQVLSEKL